METARERLARTVARMWQDGRGIGSLAVPKPALSPRARSDVTLFQLTMDGF